ncbi:MAG: hypothetical protein HY459_04065 [Parcubacteria group bacterium]|nr:hypothetical protein [Parcubacteria group bacterium]
MNQPQFIVYHDKVRKADGKIYEDLQAQKERLQKTLPHVKLTFSMSSDRKGCLILEKPFDDKAGDIVIEKVTAYFSNLPETHPPTETQPPPPSPEKPPAETEPSPPPTGKAEEKPKPGVDLMAWSFGKLTSVIDGLVGEVERREICGHEPARAYLSHLSNRLHSFLSSAAQLSKEELEKLDMGCGIAHDVLSDAGEKAGTLVVYNLQGEEPSDQLADYGIELFASPTMILEYGGRWARFTVDSDVRGRALLGILAKGSGRWETVTEAEGDREGIKRIYSNPWIPIEYLLEELKTIAARVIASK